MTDPFVDDILREAFLAVADEMFVSLQRTSQSPVVYEVLDCGVGLTDAHGELVSQGNGVAGFLALLGEAVQATLVRVPDLQPDDVVVTNDPYAGGGTHLSDIAMVRPIFYAGELVAFAAAKAHWTEVGGKDPGSWSATSTNVHQEGLQLPFVRAYRRGELDADIAAIIRANSRLPEQALGDLTAQAACLEVAQRRVHALCDRYGPATVTSAMRSALDRSEVLARAAIRQLPDGTYLASDLADRDGLGNGPFPVQVRVEVAGDEIHVDFTGSHPQVAGPINCTRSGLHSGVHTVVKAITGPHEPASDGWFRPLTVTCPDGTLFTATRPAPVGSYFESTEIASDLVWRALADACQDHLTAGHFLSVCATSIALTHPGTGEPALLVEPHAGGWGAGADHDGQSGLVSVGDGETYVIPVEVAEQRYGVRVERYAIHPGAGAGAHRGGFGLVREYRILSESATLTAALGRHDVPPWGHAGGEPGTPNRIEVVPAEGGEPRTFGKAAGVPLRRGDLVRIITGGGGGWGDPADRAPAAVEADLADGYQP
ncbi:MAG: hydantoinase B/oxoprolinase family protein [Streptosporangiales bacterium]|nr:hydantoinase B/oxoprolinase family protein [Streptosporangiales bacterium]